MLIRKDNTFEFFRNNSELLELYDELIQQLVDLPKLTIKKRKTYDHMVVLCNRRNFAYISLLDDNGAFMNEGFRIVISITPRINSARIQTITEPHPGRFSHHIIIRRKNDIDFQLIEWLKQAYRDAQ